MADRQLPEGEFIRSEEELHLMAAAAAEEEGGDSGAVDDDDEDYDDEDEEEEESEDEADEEWQERQGWWPSTPSVSFFLTAFLIGCSLLAVSVVSLVSINDHYSAAFNNTATTLRHAQWHHLKSESLLLTSIAPLYSLTGSASVLSESKELLEAVVNLTAQMVPEANSSLGFSLEQCLKDSLAELDGLPQIVVAAHTQLLDQQSRRTNFFTSEHSFGTAREATSEAAVRGPLLLSTLQQWLHDMDHSTGLAATAPSIPTTMKTLSMNVSSLLVRFYGNLQAAEAIALRTEYARSYLLMQPAMLEGQLNDTIDALTTVLELSNSSLASLENGTALSLLGPDAQLLLAFTTASTIEAVRTALEAMRTPISTVYSLLSYHQAEFQLVVDRLGKVASADIVSQLKDIGSLLHGEFGDAENVLGKCIGNLISLVDPYLAAAKEEARLENQRVVADPKHNGRRNIEIVAGVCLGPLLIWLLYAFAGTARQMKSSFLSYGTFVTCCIALVVLVAGLGGAIAGKSISIIETPRDLSGAQAALQARWEHAAREFDVADTFGRFLRDDWDADQASRTLQNNANQTTFFFSTTQAMLGLLQGSGAQDSGVHGLDSQIHRDENVYTAFNRSLHEEHSVFRALARHEGNVTDNSIHCMAVVSAVAGLMGTVPYTDIIPVDAANTKTVTTSAVARYGMIAEGQHELCNDDQVTLHLWTDLDAHPWALWLAGTFPSRYIQNYVTTLDPENKGTFTAGALTLKNSVQQHLQDSMQEVTRKQTEWYDAFVKERRLIVWMTISCLVFAEFAAWMVSWSLFGSEVGLP